MKYKPTIGMEVHVELATKSKMFCQCKNGMGQEKRTNRNTCPVCTGQPGALPVPNKKAIDLVIQAGLALNCRIAEESKFDRKNYFYPDLPKGYQISQFDQPICGKGFLQFLAPDERDGELKKKQVGITRIHLEEDTGKLFHFKTHDKTLIDLNRSGVPLMELVTEPDIKSAAEAKKFCEELRLLFRYIGISPADMEKGQMRCEANVSLYEVGKDPLSGTKVELKNLNSFKAVERGVEYEIKRQTEALEKGEKIIQETRGWDENKGQTFSQREKEEAHDYRYFPEPDILPFRIDKEEVEVMREKLPELPGEKRIRFVKEFGLRKENVDVLVADKALASFFEMVISELEEWMSSEKEELKEDQRTKIYQLTANYLVSELKKYLVSEGIAVEEIKITPENFAELIKMTYQGEINSSSAQTILEEMFTTGGDPSQIAEEKNLIQNNDSAWLEEVVTEVLASNEKAIEDFRAGNEKSIQFLLGQVMAKTKGQANPQLAMDAIRKKLES
jgi:aspartyl-tRNA(Asn)/glutamyl-tRNA(Gln) amidotransferase subunit B